MKVLWLLFRISHYMSQEARIFKQKDQYQHKKNKTKNNLTEYIRLEINLSVLVSTRYLLGDDKTSTETGHQRQGTQNSPREHWEGPQLFVPAQSHLLKHVMCDLLCFLIFFVVPLPFVRDHRHKAAFQNSRVRVFNFTIFLNCFSFWKKMFSEQHKLL